MKEKKIFHRNSKVLGWKGTIMLCCFLF